MTTPLTLTPDRNPDGATVLKAAGEIDMSNSEALAAALDDLPGRLVVDLAEVDYLDSAGLSVLFARAERLEIVINPLLASVVTYSGLATMTTVHGLESPDGTGG
ncbi:STAS domain-containing protein [Amycolatopsis magusensis]|uniref:Anti-anti-sigma factor n=1 Tax=Amycolatopsis magusensis TaxID=882444 RepID=A0ABS4Q1S7_9PSEU|nr:STAS domain-containing protein [Amycolatopsis magusensis]MBP2185639.1 anti-anti-sigma factor [Amycolatopsis magusensis]MDI5980726.1 STAS domain-containing protein [Amycolatopsis magusensis]